MMFLFIDESEKRGNSKGRYFFSLCGLMVNDKEIIPLTEKLEKLKTTSNLKTLKQLRKSMPKSKKIELTHYVKEILESHKVKVISSILGNIALRSVKNVENAYFEALTFLIERFYIHLRKENECGMIIFDKVPQNIEKKLRNKCCNFINNEIHYMYGTPKGYYKTRIYPSIFFTTDDVSILLQTSDLIATSLNSAFWKSFKEEKVVIDELPTKNEYLRIYWPLFVKSPRGKVEGWGIKVWW